MPISNKQKTLIHVAKAKVGMTDAAYRELLGSVGVESSKHLTQAKFDKVMDHFKACGFDARPVDSKTRLMGKIKKMLTGLGLTRRYADGMARNMFSIDAVKWCDADQLRRIVAALTYHQQRRQKKEFRDLGI